MTEPENFDDELFADLYVPRRGILLQGWRLTAGRYNDDEPAGKSARAAESNQYSAVQAAVEPKDEPIEDSGQHQDYNGGEVKYEEEEEDDDDEIDFNLGNGPSTTVAHHDHQDHQDHHDHQEHHDEKPSYNAAPGPPAHTRGPNAKEDG
jgi:hypothetical protein